MTIAFTSEKTVNNNELFFTKLHKDAKIPTKREEDAGRDVYACFDENYRIIPPHTTVMIPSGIASAFSPKWVALLKERGSNGTKGIGQRSGVVDSGYRGEWMIPLTNTNNKPVVIAKQFVIENAIFDTDEVIIYPYEKAISQVIFVEVPKLEQFEVDYETLCSFVSERGVGKLGSSNK